MCLRAHHKRCGGYELVNPDHAYSVVEIGSLGDIGIYPVAAASGKSIAQRKEPQLQPTDRQQQSEGKVPSLEALIGRKAKEVLEGGAPYCGGSGEGIDRSAQLTGFVKEIYSWVNLLTEKGLAVRGTPEALIERAIAALGIEDKADRVLGGIESGECCHANPEWALGRYHWLAGVRTKRWGRRGDNRRASTSASAEADPADPGEPPLLTREECRDRLQDAVARHQSLTEQELLLGELADASELHPVELRQLLTAVRMEAEQHEVLLQEASAIELDLARQRRGRPLRWTGCFRSLWLWPCAGSPSICRTAITWWPPRTWPASAAW